MKPEKIIYDNQEEVHSKILDYVRERVNGVGEAYLWGSVVRKEFGKYVEKYGVHEGSDIDIVIFPSTKLLDDWKDLNTEQSWWRLYRGGKIEINGTIHRLDMLVIRKEKEGLARNWIKDKSEEFEQII